MVLVVAVPVRCFVTSASMIKSTFIVRTISKQRLAIRLMSVMAANGTSNPPSAEYKQLGKSGLRVSVPILGAMSFGDKRWMPWVIEEDKVRLSPSS